MKLSRIRAEDATHAFNDYKSNWMSFPFSESQPRSPAIRIARPTRAIRQNAMLPGMLGGSAILRE